MITDPTLQVSEHFHAKEFACHCCGTLLLDERLVESLEALRALSDLPIRVNSGYRCERHNAAIGGSPNSQHKLGRAADIVIAGKHPATVALLATQIPGFAAGGIGRYNTFTHVDVRTTGEARWHRLHQ